MSRPMLILAPCLRNFTYGCINRIKIRISATCFFSYGKSLISESSEGPSYKANFLPIVHNDHDRHLYHQHKWASLHLKKTTSARVTIRHHYYAEIKKKILETRQSQRRSIQFRTGE